ncbi:MAG: chalcone isomerase family protein [Gammaproteobacteria bacterium]|nr:chalcone isomerase family protein [Gammaproteobacteria bacterium]MDH5800984.1 chalcone isomerase family protein [Gammaproteobacteria bacterium]
MKTPWAMILVFLFTTSVCSAREISGVVFPESVSVQGSKLVLNGAGIRSKFFFSIYVGALYLSERAAKPQDVFDNANSKRVVMHVLYKDLEAAKITAAWDEGFKKNNSSKDYESLQDRLQTFNSFFNDSKTGDVILLDYIPDSGTRMTFNNELRGTIPGRDFYTALLKVWLGDRPADSNLKEAMLGQD